MPNLDFLSVPFLVDLKVLRTNLLAEQKLDELFTLASELFILLFDLVTLLF